MATDSLFEQLKHPNPRLRERAMLELAEVRDEQTIPRLLDILGEPDVNYRRSAVKALGVIGIDSVSPVVGVLLKSEDMTIRASCVKALAQVAFNHPDTPFPEEGLQALATVLHDPNPVVNIATAMALGEIGVPALDTLIAAVQTTDNPALAIAVVNAISSINDPRAGEILNQIAQDESVDAYVRESATSAVSRFDLMSQYQARE
ncbi:HEAT repeat domain-containing protein [Capilliphycus salinus ALCB114379]|uniref:HEAT repeat domain-containing protein n=1 Tax=Capilliphycus salinus TaxID=2768948 RepID=UPI0039A62FBD